MCSPLLASLSMFFLALTVVSAQQGPILSGTSRSDFRTPPTACDTAIVGGGPGEQCRCPFEDVRVVHLSKKYKVLRLHVADPQ